ncbi:MAG: hypothetical protein QNJ38_08795 [Prochloraceae cyanobacterium]|nr:hypothetical protein [Prochloraceae cyanobacterium]
MVLITGTFSSDYLDGTLANEFISGSADNDTIDGYGGFDTLFSGVGANTFKIVAELVLKELVLLSSNNR